MSYDARAFDNQACGGLNAASGHALMRPTLGRALDRLITALKAANAASADLKAAGVEPKIYINGDIFGDRLSLALGSGLLVDGKHDTPTPAKDT